MQNINASCDVSKLIKKKRGLYNNVTTQEKEPSKTY